MTSRVQKGGPIFRPIKSRARSDAPQADSWRSPPPTSCQIDPALQECATIDPSLADTAFISPTTSPHRSTPAPPTLISRLTTTKPSPSPFPPSASKSSQPIVYLQDAYNRIPTPRPTPISTPTSLRAGVENIPQPSVIIEPPIKLPETPANVASPSSSQLDPAIDAALPISRPNEIKSSRKSHTSRKTPRKRKVEDSDKSNENTPKPARAKRKRRESSGTPHSRRSRGPSLPPFDPDADPGEEIDPTVVTMASLCNDTGQGRVSRKAAEILSNHAAWRSQNKEKRARMKALMELKKYGRDSEVDTFEMNHSTPDKNDAAASEPGPSNITPVNPPIVDETGGGFDYSQDLAPSRFNVQVRIGPNGETFIDEESLVIDRTEDEDTTYYTHVVESDHTKFVNSGSYGRRYRGSRWSAEETEQFYSALAQYGENYELIAYVLPGRDRKSCKNKFKAEDRKNPARINYCLTNSIPVDMATLSRMTGKDFSGPVPEIRAPPLPSIDELADFAEDPPGPEPTVYKNRASKESAPNDEVIIIGDAESFVHDA